ncbi:MAG: hypothetical protein IJS90_00445 [Clostridia bacterium]|nr:hypothetical protein [Clostridia bacterium]
MANCPNCGKKLTLANLSQFCPECGVNMRFVNFEENFFREAKYAELSQAGIKVKFRRFKAAFVGSKLTIVRLCVSLLPILSLLIPTGGYTIKLPFYESSAGFGVMGLVSLFTGGDLGYILGMTGSDFSGGTFTWLRTALFSFLAVAGIAVFVLLATILCFLSIKNMQKIISAFSFAGIAAAIAALVLINVFASKCSGTPVVSGSGGFGLIVSIAAFAAVIAVNMILDKKGVPVEYGEGMEERARLFKELKAGRIDLDSLPQPVVETSETRKIDEEIAQEKEDYRKAHEKEAGNNG